MKPFDAFMTLITPHAKGVPIPTANSGILLAAIEFCERTRLWKYNDSFTVNPTDYEVLCAPDGAVVHEIESSRFNGRLIDRKLPAQLDAEHPGWRTDMTVAQASRCITQLETNTVILYPRAPGVLDLSLWLKPAHDARELPDFMVDQYRNVIAEGALSYILMTPGQPFSSPDLAQFYRMKFDSLLGTLSYKSTVGQQRARPRVKATFY